MEAARGLIPVASREARFTLSKLPGREAALARRGGILPGAAEGAAAISTAAKAAVSLSAAAKGAIIPTGAAAKAALIAVTEAAEGSAAALSPTALKALVGIARG